MRKIVLAALGAVVVFGAAEPADAQWRRDRTIVVEQRPTLNTGVIATLFALQLARRAAKERESLEARRAPSRELVPLK